jgi:hypothetical protein
MTTNTTKQFTDTVTGTTNLGVQWSVDGVVGGATATGTVSTTGVYTAPATGGSHTVTVTSNADTTKSASAAVTVTSVAVSISPTTATVTANTTKQFTATVTGTTNVGVQWSVDGVVGGAAATGTVSTTGVYTAPATAGSHTVTVTSNADTTQTASAAVTVTSVAVTINPTTASVTTSTTKQFTATVTGTTNVGVKWSVDGVIGGSSTTGTVSTGGLYTAPSTAGTHTVSVTSNADTTQTASAAVTVTAISITISPTTVSVTASTTKQFTATVTGTSNVGVQWSVDGVVGGAAATGTISTTGVYTAPATAGSHTVTVTSNANTTQTASAAVTVTTIAVTVSPTSISMTTNTTKQFTGTVTGTTNVGVKWSVDGVVGGAAATGTVTTGGLYTAPTTAGSHTVTVTSNADSTKSASAAVTVSAVSVTISPTSATVVGGQTKQFIPAVTGSTNIGVKWYVDGILNGNDTVGNITTAGLYLSPNLSGKHTVMAVANADNTKSASAAVTVTGNIYVELTPADACIAYGGTQQFTATMFGTTNQTATWQVDGVTGGNSSVGIINSIGVYTAPHTTANHTIKAISQASTSKTQSVTASVSNTISMSITPSPTQVPVSETIPFTARVCGVSPATVTWYVDNVAGGNATVGTIDGSGNYTAPATTGTHTIKAVSTANTSKSATATVTVGSGVVADFGNRTASKYPIPVDMIGSNLTNLTDPKGMALLSEAGMVHTRVYSNIQNIFTSTTKADWTKIDPIVTTLQTAGIRPMLQITYTPSFLVPTVTGCSPSFRMPPTNYASYANIAAQVVAHMDQKFPGFVIDYEIWNEPDLTTFCVNPATDAQRRTVYITLYAAVAKAMHAQAVLDGQTIRVGGPTTVDGTSWVPYLVSDPNASPYVDFISYHQYPTGTTNIQAGMTWDTPHGTQTLYSIMQGSGGFAAWFTNAAKQTHAGLQPHAANTPVYVSEFNDGWPFVQDCCRNSPTYAPVMNGLFLVDYLNTVYSGSGAVPGKLFYYSASAFPDFCLIGTWDSEMSCQYPAGGTPVPYPSYHPYNLVSSPNYLGLVNGGNMAVSVNPGTTLSGLAATAFYTASNDSILIVNPTSTSYSGVTVTFNNAGISSAQGSYYLIEGQNNTIVSVPVTLTPTSSGYSTSVDIPPYTTLAVSIQ